MGRHHIGFGLKIGAFVGVAYHALAGQPDWRFWLVVVLFAVGERLAALSPETDR